MRPTGYFLEHLWLIPLFPLISATLMFLLRRNVPKNVVNVLCVGSVFLSFAYSCGAVYQLMAAAGHERLYQLILFEWITPGPYRVDHWLTQFVADWGYLLDPLSSVMILVITGVGLLIHIYSIGYMHSEEGYYRYFGYLNLFMFAMLTLVLANNLLQLFVGWEGVGLCSYLLIGFYFLRDSAASAGKKAFLVNRIGDAGFLLGILLVSCTFGTVRFTSAGLPDPITNVGMDQMLYALIDQHRMAYGAPVLTVIGLLLFAGATGKSAQLPLYVWLPDAMEGPTPVSALIHAATMVTAGVYMVARMNAIYQLAPLAMDIVAIVGAVTAIFAASMALVQTDIKKVLAYSTISQLGYMFLALGVGAFAAGIFHLMTHAFFKALLFLGAGAVIHSLSGEQDLRKMGGLWNTFPRVSRPFMVATLAIAGFPPLAGFFSKDEILSHTFNRAQMLDRYLLLWVIGWMTAGLTALYMFRLFFLTFLGRSRVPTHVEHHIHQPPNSMTAPLAALMALSIAGGWFALPVLWGDRNYFAEFLQPVLGGVEPDTGTVELGSHPLVKEYLLMAASVAVASLGLWLAYRLFIKNPKLPQRIAEAWPRVHRLLFRKYYVDEIYDALFVNRLKDLSVSLGVLDAKLIDGAGVDGTAAAARFSSRVSMWWDKWIVDGLVNLVAKISNGFSVPVRMLQTGMFSTYAALILLGLVILLAYYGHHMQIWVRNLR